MQAAEFFIYNKETTRYIRKGDWKILSAEGAVLVLKELWEDRGTPVSTDEAHSMLYKIRTLGLTTQQIQLLKKSFKEKTTRIDFETIYSELRHKLGIRFFMGSGYVRFVYRCNEQKEVEPVTYESDRSIYDALYGDDEIWRELKEYYNSSPLVAPFKSKFTFTTFIETLIKTELLNDETLKFAKEPAILSWEPDEYAFKKIDSAKIVSGPTPTWDEFTSRLDHAELFMAWVWSVVEPKNTVRQVCWIRGGGQDGKSAVQKALEYVIGEKQSYSMKRHDLDSQFFLGNVYGKMLLTYPDCGYYALLKHDAIKQITGGDSASVEKKHESSKSGTLKAKVFVHSNRDPRINPESRFQTTRLLRLVLSKTDIRDAQFEGRLKDEVWAFLAKCKPMYDKHVAPGHDNINIPQHIFQDMISSCSGGNYLIAKNFERANIEYGDDNICEFGDLSMRWHDYQMKHNLSNEELRYIRDEFTEILREKGLDSPQTITINGVDDIGFRGFKLKKD